MLHTRKMQGQGKGSATILSKVMRWVAWSCGYPCRIRWTDVRPVPRRRVISVGPTPSAASAFTCLARGGLAAVRLGASCPALR